MTALVGSFGVIVATLGALGGLTVLGTALARRDSDAQRGVVRWVIVMVGGIVIAVAAMEVALLRDDFSLEYVASNSTRATPALYKVATLWGALEGSILLWALVLCGYVGAAVWWFRSRVTDRLVGVSTFTMLVVCLFFFVLLLTVADPFGTLAVAPPDGDGLNPLLRNHPLMAIHPIALYMGYVGFTVPFAFAVGALVTGRLGEGWLVATRAWTLVAWGSLTAGIVLGAWWSYEVLGWGGYWAWDPVENASLLPWLTATAFLHSVIVQERRGMLRVWNLSLLMATFALTIFGTFLTRSGVIDSVHNFTASSVGPAFLAFFAAITVVSIGLIFWRGDRLRAPGSIDSPVSREGSFLVNNLLFAAAAFVVVLGTIFPLAVEALNGDTIAVGRPYFDRMLLPVGLGLLFFMGVSPLLTWRSTSPEVVSERALGPAIAGVAALVVAVASGALGFFELVGFALGGFVIGSSLRQIVLSARRLGLGRAITGRTGGGMIAHIGVAVVAFGFIASNAYGEEGEFVLAPGETASVAGHDVRFLGLTDTMEGENRVVSARVDIDGRGVHEPAVTRFPTFGTPIATPSVATGFIDDVYVTMSTIPEEGDESIALRVVIKPLIMWLWLGGAVIGLGTMLALVPAPPGATRPSDRSPGRPEPAEEASREAHAAAEDPVGAR